MFADRVMAHAREHYSEGGWDVIYECWTNEEVDQLLEEEGSEEAAWLAIESLVDVWSDRQAVSAALAVIDAADAINSAILGE